MELGLALHGIDISLENGRALVTLSGEIDLASLEPLEHELAPTFEAPPPVLVLDLREVTFLDSSGLRLILRLDRGQREAGSRLAVVRGGRRVARVLELTGAEDHLELIDDPDQV
jgi:anti-anti-sigma factor